MACGPRLALRGQAAVTRFGAANSPRVLRGRAAEVVLLNERGRILRIPRDAVLRVRLTQAPPDS